MRLSLFREVSTDAEPPTFYQLPEERGVAGVVSRDEMSAVYTGRMAAKGAPGRAVYDRLMAALPLGRCPL